MGSEKHSFAFKLSARQKGPANGKWRARDGVSIAGCTRTNDEFDNWRDSVIYPGGPATPRDEGYYC